MDEAENIRSLLVNYYKNIGIFFGEIIEKRLELPNYENCMLVQRLLQATHKLAKLNEYEDFDNGFIEDEELENEYFEPSGKRFRLDSGLYILDKTLFKGEQHCEGFKYIFQNIGFSHHQEVDTKITEMLAQAKSFEFLSKLDFRFIEKMDHRQNNAKVDFIARKIDNRYAILVSLLYSAKHVEEHLEEYDESHAIRSLTNDITYVINQKYSQLEEFCQSNYGIYKGIIFISSGRDYFGHIKYENSLYGLQPSKINAVLNKEWTTRKSGGKSYKYLHHIVITKGRNVGNAIIYPSLN